MGNYAKIRERDKGGKFIKPTIPSGFDKKAYKKEYYKLHKMARTLKFNRIIK